MIFGFNLISSSKFDAEVNSNPTTYSECGFVLNYENFSEIEIVETPRDVYIFPELENIKCLGVPNLANYSSNDSVLYVEYEMGSNYKFFKYLNNFGNYILLFLLLLTKKNKLQYPLIIYFVFNFGIYNLLTPVESLIEIIYPVPPLYGDRFVKFFVNNLFIILFSIKLNSNKLYLSLFTFFLFFSNDFVGIFIFILFLKNKFNFKFSEREKRYLINIPFAFYFFRIISGIFTYFDDVWISMAQTIYRGYTRYPDMQRVLFFLKCNNDPNATITEGYFIGIQCNELGGGPLDAYLPFYGDVNLWSKILGSLSIITLIYLYKQALVYFENNQVPLVFIFLSPPLLHLTHYGNDDLPILLICSYALWNFRKNNFFKLFLILITALFNLHPTSILVGILAVSVKKTNYKVFINTLILLAIFTGLFFYDITSNNAQIAVMPWGDYGFGIYLDLINLKSNFSIPYSIGSILIFSIVLLILRSKFFNNLYNEVDFSKMNSTRTKYDEYAIIGITFWYVITFLYSNVSYRLPSFYLLFFLILIFNNNKIKTLIIGLIFLEPVIWHSEVLVRNIFLTINNLCHYLIFLICFRYLISYSKTNLLKLFKDIKNKELKYRPVNN